MYPVLNNNHSDTIKIVQTVKNSSSTLKEDHHFNRIIQSWECYSI